MSVGLLDVIHIVQGLPHVVKSRAVAEYRPLMQHFEGCVPNALSGVDREISAAYQGQHTLEYAVSKYHDGAEAYAAEGDELQALLAAVEEEQRKDYHGEKIWTS